MTASASSHDLAKLVAKGESKTLELKRSTGEMREAMHTICGFANGHGGRVVIGAKPDGQLVGQQVSEQTLHDIAAARNHFEPPLAFDVERVNLPNGRAALVLTVAGISDSVPFTYDGRAYERVDNTTRTMTQARYEALLLERAHSRRRWENQPAVDISLDDLDHEEILRTRDAAVRQRRISAGTSMDVGDVLDRLGLRRAGVITQAAQVLYGTRFLPDYPQGLLKMGRFRGTKITGDILDNRQEHLHAFAIAREGMAFLDRTLPLAARFPEGKLFREDRLPVPPAALREVLLNAVMHRDYSDPSGYVAIAVFDDRIEIRSVGRLPRGITPESLAGPHRSVPRNPLIAEAFHRTGAVEIWGRGTNRVLEECEQHGIKPPTFEEQAGAVVVTFRAAVALGAETRHQVGTKSALSPHQVLILQSAQQAVSIADLMRRCGRSDRTKFRDQVIRPLLEAGLLEMTIPGKPRSSLQQYRTTTMGAAAAGEEGST